MSLIIFVIMESIGSHCYSSSCIDDDDDVLSFYSSAKNRIKINIFLLLQQMIESVIALSDVSSQSQ